MKLVELEGIQLFVREEQPAWDDLHVINEVITENCYRVDPAWFKGNPVVDIGTNIGSFSLLLAKKYGVKDIYSFEPEPHNFDLLKMNNELNGEPLKIFNKAVGKEGILYCDNGSGHTQTHPEMTWGVPVEVVNLNDVLKDIDKVDLIKMDCEGGEYDIVEFTSDETWQKVEMIIGEFHSWYWEEDPTKHKKMTDRLEKFFDISYYGFKNSNFVARKK